MAFQCGKWPSFLNFSVEGLILKVNIDLRQRGALSRAAICMIIQGYGWYDGVYPGVYHPGTRGWNMEGIKVY